MKNTFLLFLLVLLIFNLPSKAINPEREYKFTPDMRGLSYEEYQIKTPDNYSVNVWEYKLADSIKVTRTIITVGTDAGNMGYMIWQSKAFVEKGIRVISFDYRGFGKSSDFQINKDFLFHPEFGIDLDSVIKATRKKYPGSKLGLYALSMGTYVSLIRKQKIDFLIAEGFYNSPAKVVARIKSNKNKIVLLPTIAASIEKISPEIPVMIFCASGDKTTIPEDAKEFSKENETTIIEFEGDHLNGLSKFTEDEPGDQYVKMVTDFLEAHHL